MIVLRGANRQITTCYKINYLHGGMRWIGKLARVARIGEYMCPKKRELAKMCRPYRRAVAVNVIPGRFRKPCIAVIYTWNNSSVPAYLSPIFSSSMRVVLVVTYITEISLNAPSSRSPILTQMEIVVLSISKNRQAGDEMYNCCRTVSKSIRYLLRSVTNHIRIADAFFPMYLN